MLMQATSEAGFQIETREIPLSRMTEQHDRLGSAPCAAVRGAQKVVPGEDGCIKVDWSEFFAGRFWERMFVAISSEAAFPGPTEDRFPNK
jgi:hypothetical protein